jgi:sec-independent protein translocase protein TatB
MSELAIIFSVALVVLGPKKLPGLVQQVGRWVGRARHMARQFREQLEQEVNSINAVKPVPRNVEPEVGPPAPPAAATPETPPVEAQAASAAVPEPEPLPEQVHPEAQIYFAMNGSEPDVVAHNPYEPQPLAPEHEAALVESESAADPAAAPLPKREEPQHPASVEVIFPHDHG